MKQMIGTETFGQSIEALMNEKDNLRIEMDALVNEAMTLQQEFLKKLAAISKKQEENILKGAAADEAIKRLAGAFFAEA